MNESEFSMDIRVFRKLIFLPNDEIGRIAEFYNKSAVRNFSKTYPKVS